MKAVNDAFVKKLKESTSSAGAAKPGIDALDAALQSDETLEKIGKKFLEEWKDGFLGLEWNLVKELQEEGFKWGATFGDPDIHHFEL